MIVRVVGPRSDPPLREAVLASLDALDREVGVGMLVAAAEPGVEAIAREWAIGRGIAVRALGQVTPDALIVLAPNFYTERLEAAAIAAGIVVRKPALVRPRKVKTA